MCGEITFVIDGSGKECDRVDRAARAHRAHTALENTKEHETSPVVALHRQLRGKKGLTASV